MHGGSSVVPGALFLHRRLPEIVGVEEGHRDGAAPGEDGREEAGGRLGRDLNLDLAHVEHALDRVCGPVLPRYGV